MEKLKQLLGEELWKQVSEKLGDKKYIFGEAEQYIPKHRFDEVSNMAEMFKNQIAERDKQLAELKKLAGDNEELKTKLAEMQETNKKAAEELVKAKRDYAIDLELMKARPKNLKALKALIDDSKIEWKDDKLSGLEEQLEALKKSDSYLFEDDVPTGTGKKPGETEKPEPFTKEQALRIRQGLF